MQPSPFCFLSALDAPGRSGENGEALHLLRPSFGFSSSDTYAADRGKEEERSMRDEDRDQPAEPPPQPTAPHRMQAELCQPSLLEPFLSYIQSFFQLCPFTISQLPAVASIFDSRTQQDGKKLKENDAV